MYLVFNMHLRCFLKEQINISLHDNVLRIMVSFFLRHPVILDSMCISLSGGILMVPQKHRQASKFTILVFI